MMEPNDKLALLKDMIKCCYPIYLWQYNRQGELLWTDCEQDHLRSLLEKSGNILYLCERSGSNPVCLGSIFSTLWGAVYGTENDGQEVVYIIGPVLHGAVSPKTLEEAALRLVPDASRQEEFMHQLNGLPLVRLTTMQNFILMLHFVVTGEKLDASSIHYPQHGILPADSRNKPRRDRRKVYLAEKALLANVREGNLNYHSAQQQAGILSLGIGVKTQNPLNQSILSVATYAALCTRAAIEGGLPADTAYTVGDQYIQEMVGCTTVSQLREVSHRMYDDFINRVHRIQMNTSVSKNTRSICEYIKNHVEDDLSLSTIASAFGYTEYYLSRRFKEEMGSTIGTYIDFIRMERAKILLESTDIPIAEIANTLHYCSSSRFGQVFQKIVGQLPSAYRKEKQQV